MHFLLKLLLLAQVCYVVLGDSEPGRLCSYCDGNLELGIVLDSSSSISRADFLRGKTFLKEFLGNFLIGQDSVRVSLISYGREPHVEDAFNLTTYGSGEEVAEAIDNLEHRGTTYTATGAAIEFMRVHQLGSRFVRSGVPKVSVVITDGNSQEPDVTEREAREARDEDIVIFAIGVGHKIDHSELLNIAGVEERVDRVEGYDKLTTIVDWLAKQTCVKNQ